MLKSLAIVGLLLGGFYGAWSQVPGDGGQQQENTQEQQKTADPSKPVVAIEAQSGTHKQEQGSEKPSQYPWRELYAPANVPNWVLAFLAGVAGWLALRTLGAIQLQADLMKDQSDLMVEKERAKLRIELDEFRLRKRFGFFWSEVQSPGIIGKWDDSGPTTDNGEDRAEVDQPPNPN